MRIQKYLSQNKILSRREAEEYIRNGLIKLNGEVVKEMGVQIDPEKDKIEVMTPDSDVIPEKITVAVYKPRGIVSSKVESEGRTIFEFFPELEHLNTVGRLDKSSEGLILLSNDGAVTSAVTGDKHTIEKEYEVGVREDVDLRKLDELAKGILLDDGMTLPAKTEKIEPHVFGITIKEGRKHQIRRMADAVRWTIFYLKRVRIGNIELGNLESGDYRMLTKEEVKKLKEMSLT